MASRSYRSLVFRALVIHSRIYAGQFLSVMFSSSQCFKLAYVFCVHSTAQLNDHVSILCPRDLQHSPSPGNSRFRNSNHRANIKLGKLGSFDVYPGCEFSQLCSGIPLRKVFKCALLTDLWFEALLVDL